MGEAENMNANKEKKKVRIERDYYKPIKAKLEELLGTKFSNFHLEITADKKFSNRLKAEISPYGHRDIIFRFLNEASPNIKDKKNLINNFFCFFINNRNKETKANNVYQTKKY